MDNWEEGGECLLSEALHVLKVTAVQSQHGIKILGVSWPKYALKVKEGQMYIHRVFYHRIPSSPDPHTLSALASTAPKLGCSDKEASGPPGPVK